MAKLTELAKNVRNILRKNNRDVVEVVDLSEKEADYITAKFSPEKYDTRRSVVISRTDNQTEYILQIRNKKTLTL
jgi:hypothetical protein